MGESTWVEISADAPRGGHRQRSDHGVDSTDHHFSALKIWMFENKFVSLPSHLKTIEPMEVHRGQELCVIQKLQKVISRTDPMIK